MKHFIESNNYVDLGGGVFYNPKTKTIVVQQEDQNE